MNNEKTELNPENTVCMYRWSYPVIKYSLGLARTCCRSYPNEEIADQQIQELGVDAFINSKAMQQRRLEMLSGIKHPSCSSCWKLEEAGIKSPRSTVKEFTDYIKHREGGPNSFAEIVKNKKKFLLSKNPQILEIQIDNLCDLKCIYCNAEYSTRWESEKRAEALANGTNPATKPKSSNLFNETFWTWVKSISGELQFINFIGGEPLLSPRFYEILDFLLSDQITFKNRVMISIVSNFNSTEARTEKFAGYVQKLAQKFDLSIDASNEAKSERGEFIRDGLDFAKFEKNVETIIDLLASLKTNQNILNFGFHIANNALSSASIREYIQWIKAIEDRKDYPVHLRQNIVSFPDYLSPSILTPDFAKNYFDTADFIRSNANQKHSYYQGVTWLSYADFLDSIGNSIVASQPGKDVQKRFYSWVRTKEVKTNANFLKVYPEYSEFLNHCASV